MRIHKHKYRRHKATGRAFVELGGRRIYLGAYGSPESRQLYDQTLAEWTLAGRPVAASGSADPVSQVGQDGITVVELVDRYMDHVETYYRKPDGTPTQEQDNIARALGPLTDLYGLSPAASFGPLALQAVRQVMIRPDPAGESQRRGWCRTNTNKAIGRIKHMFKWATSQQLLPASVFEALRSVDGLRAGRSEATEAEPVRPVADVVVEATLQKATPTIRAMIRLQVLTGMRPGELCRMRTGDIERESAVWIYRPTRHKTEHHGHSRRILIGPQAREILEPFLKPDLQVCVFSPRESEAERQQARRAARKTPAGQGDEPGANRQAKPGRRAREAFNVASYGAAIDHCCDRAFPAPDPLGKRPDETLEAWRERLVKNDLVEQLKAWRKAHRWSPNQLRHNFATRMRRQYGIDVAQTIMGHRLGSAVTEIYAEANVEKAVEIMAKIG